MTKSSGPGKLSQVYSHRDVEKIRINLTSGQKDEPAHKRQTEAVDPVMLKKSLFGY